MVCETFVVLLDSEQDNLFEGISKFSLDLSNRIDNLVALRTDENAPMTIRYPPVRPCEFLTLRPREFYKILQSQRERLLFPFTDSEITQIEDDFNALKRAYLGGTLSFEVDQKSFGDSWKMYGERYFKLCRFYGRMATMFPGTSTVEADFPLLGNEETPERNNISKLSLAGEMHSKQWN